MISIVIPFCNEGVEVKHTVESVLAHQSMNNEIILLNDASDDCYDYQNDVTDLRIKWPNANIQYCVNGIRKGPARNKSLGITYSMNDVILLLDAHMRLYDSGFDTELERLLTANKTSIYCSNTRILEKCGDTIIDKGTRNTFGAMLSSTKFKEFSAIWNYKQIEKYKYTGFCEVPCILGAAYAFRKDWYIKIGGYDGLVGFGYEEPLISVKTFMHGGSIFVLHDWYTGHVYRKTFPYKNNSTDVGQNEIFIYRLFTGTGATNTLSKLERDYSEKYVAYYVKVMNELNKRRTILNSCYRLLRNNQIRSFDEYWLFNAEYLKANGKNAAIDLT